MALGRRPPGGIALGGALVLAAIGLAAIGGLSGCARGPRIVDRTVLEQGIVDQSASQEFPITSVACPDDHPLVAGDTFTCQATLGTGEPVTIDATQTDGKGNITWNRHEAIVTGEAFAGVEDGALSQEYGLTITLACPARIVVDDGDTFVCTGTDDRGHDRTVTFTAVHPRDGEFTHVVEGLPAPSTTTTSAG